MTLASSDSDKVALLTLSIFVLICSLAAAGVTFLPLWPKEEVVAEMQGTVPDTSVFRVNPYVPDGPTAEDTVKLQTVIYRQHFDDEEWHQIHSNSDGDGISTTVSGDGAGSSPASTPPARPLERKKATESSDEASSEFDDVGANAGMTRAELNRRIRAARIQEPTLLPSVSAAAERIAYRINHAGQMPAAPAADSITTVSRPVVNHIAANVLARQRRRKSH